MFRPFVVVFRWLVRSRIIAQLIWPLIVAIPTLALAATQIQNLPAVEGILKPVRDWFDGHPYISVGCVFWTLGLTIANWLLYPKIEKLRRSPAGLDAKVVSGMLVQLDHVVGAKMDRFGLEALRCRTLSNGQNGQDIFLAITQPHEQIRQLIDKLYLVF